MSNMRLGLVTILLAMGAPTPARAQQVLPAVEALRAAAPGQSRLDAAAKLAELGPNAIPELIERLGLPRTATDAERRAVLRRFGAELPNPDGRWVQPPRPKNKRGEVPLEPDWLGELSRMDQSDPAVLESLETVALIRALVATNDPRGADAILELAFAADGIAFRDECGRMLRRMSPYSLPTLLRASLDKRKAGGAYARYANYQLDRLDKGRPGYALAAAPDDAVEVAMLEAIRDGRHPDAVDAVLDRANARSNLVRMAARETFLAYVTGPPPPAAPKARRKLPGGRVTELLPKYLTYRELAENALAFRLEQLTGEAPKRQSGLTMAKQLFALYDQKQTEAWDPAMAEGLALAAGSNWGEATAKYDTILMQEPLYVRRAEMVPAYLELGRQLGHERKWDQAILVLDKAFALDPAGPRAREVEAELHYARSEGLRAQGADPGDELEQALAADPEHPSAHRSVKMHAQSRRTWMLYASGASGVLALVMGGLAWRQRIRESGRSRRGRPQPS